ncbi:MULTISPECIES: hypothetical protein [unclassified Providencia]|uniref:hypothetical protein n=1 Tax=unclassified Providencia TaxID=2633465 RepID=UPI002349FDE2|nr:MULTISPECIES: hypothetical protein [unclassified Providencia]
MKISKITIGSLITFAIILFVAPFAIYGYYFHDLGISSINANWGSFGSFLSGIFSFFTALFTLISVIVLISTFRKTIDFSQQQIKIAQNESELNNFNFIISLIHKNIKESGFFTKRTKQINIDYVYEEINTYYLYGNFKMQLGWAIRNTLSPNDTHKLIIDMSNDSDLKNNINKYVREYASMMDNSCLANIYPLVKLLCVKILSCEDLIQKEILMDILISAIDEDILYWSLAFINDNKFDSFMILPRVLAEEFEES